MCVVHVYSVDMHVCVVHVYSVDMYPVGHACVCSTCVQCGHACVCILHDRNTYLLCLCMYILLPLSLSGEEIECYQRTLHRLQAF